MVSKTDISMGHVHEEVEIEHPDSKLIPIIKNIVKNNVEVIVLLILSEMAMCGYDIIKEIYRKYNVLLSQGTVYPLLYSLKEEGVIEARFTNGNMKSKIYCVTSDGEEIIKNRLADFIEAQTYFLQTIDEKR